MATLTTSIVIPAYNGIAFLQSSLPAALALKADEVVVVDDASTDGTAKFVAQNFPQIKLIKHTKNLRFPATVNDGVKQASGEIIILLNQDAFAEVNLLKYVRPHFRHPQIFAVTFSDNQHGWAKARFERGFLEYESGPTNIQTHPSLWANGGSCAFRKKIWDDLGGFDQSFTPAYFEDLDISWHAWRHGYETIWDSQAVISHPNPGSSFNKVFQPKHLQRIKDRNFLLSQWKNLDSNYLLIHLLAVFSRVISHPGYLIPVLMAIWHLRSVFSSCHQAKLSTSQILSKFT